MADTTPQQSNGKTHNSNVKTVRSTRVDLTPMVDLGFLLITFFVFTTTVSQPACMNLVMPKDSNDSMLVKRSGSLIILPAGDDLVCYYYGDEAAAMKTTHYPQLRSIIMDKKQKSKADEFFVIIKPYRDATYKNAVAILDEMIINDVGSYAMAEPDANENKLIGRLKEKY